MSLHTRVMSCLLPLVFCLLGGLPALADDDTYARAVQAMLVWTGDYDGFVDGKIGPDTQAAIKTFQFNHGFDRTGELTDEQSKLLGAEGERAIQATGFEIRPDRRTGTSLGIPTNLTRIETTTQWGSRWSSLNKNFIVDTMNFNKEYSMDQLYGELTHGKGREITYKYRADNMIIVSGKDPDDTEFYFLCQSGGSDIRGVGMTWDKTMGDRFRPVVGAVANSFSAFPEADAAPATVEATPAQQPAATPATTEPQAAATSATPVAQNQAAAPDTSTVKASLRACLNGLGDCPKAFAKGAVKKQ